VDPVADVDRPMLAIAAAAGFAGVALGAFGAHGLKRFLERAPDGAQRERWWQTAAQYHLVHALAIGLASTLGPDARVAATGWLFLVGIALFSGSLYAMTLTGRRKLGAITPLGGLAFLAGWAALAYGALAG
jgi:uncharacterized membrane protein YgdD (TMEM256/DUF423 family)